MKMSRRFLVVSAASFGALVALAGPASAHAEANATAEPAGRTGVTVSLTHGCDGNPTTGLRVSLPAGATAVRGIDSDGWISSVTTSEISWTGGSLPATKTGGFAFSLVLTQPAGSTVVLPTIQSCANNSEIAWIEKDTGNHSESGHPAPQFEVPINDSAAVTVTAGSNASPSTTARMATQSNAITDEGSETSTAGQYVFIGVCAVLVGGAGALFLKYRKKSPKV
ncbi:MAG: DUF1775 domain-containing protein [Actinomycetota bacterium]